MGKTQYIRTDISVDFIKKRPTSDLELVFKDGNDVKHQSNKFKKNDPIYWNIDMYVYFGIFYRAQLLIDFVQLCSYLHQCQVDHPACASQHKRC
jgi:hypothetical protein